MPDWSPPSRGAWIEMPVFAQGVSAKMRRPPRGGRGLKSVYHSRMERILLVAPLAGGVD